MEEINKLLLMKHTLTMSINHAMINRCVCGVI